MALNDSLRNTWRIYYICVDTTLKEGDYKMVHHGGYFDDKNEQNLIFVIKFCKNHYFVNENDIN